MKLPIKFGCQCQRICIANRFTFTDLPLKRQRQVLSIVVQRRENIYFQVIHHKYTYIQSRGGTSIYFFTYIVSYGQACIVVKRCQLKIQVKHCQRHNRPRHCFYNLNQVQIWSSDGGAIWWVNLELMLLVPPDGQNWNQQSVFY